MGFLPYFWIWWVLLAPFTILNFLSQVRRIYPLKFNKPNYGTAEVPINTQFRGKWCFITGGTKGIGYWTAYVLALHGVHVVIGSHNKVKGPFYRDRLRGALESRGIDPTIEWVECNLAYFESVVQCVENLQRRYPPISLLILNGMMIPKKFTITLNAQETLYQTAFLSNFLLVHLLKDSLLENPPSRIVWVSSDFHKLANSPTQPPPERIYNPMRYFSSAKLACVMATYAFHSQFVQAEIDINVNCVNPGLVATGILRRFPIPFHHIWKSFGRGFFLVPLQGAESVVWAAISPKAGTQSGQYIFNSDFAESSGISHDPRLIEKLWHSSMYLLTPYLEPVEAGGAAG